MASKDDKWRDSRFKNAEAYIESNDTGMYVPVDTGEGVSFPKDSVGSGPVGDAYVEKRGKNERVRTARTANAYIKDRTGGRSANLWINDFSADYGLTGTDAQSKYKNDFNARFLAQPRYRIKAQCFTQEQYNRTVKMIRQGMIRQLATGTSANDLFELRIEDRTYLNRYRRTTRGGYKGWTLTGYVESIGAGPTRFVNSPVIEFVFVAFNAEEGIMKALDGIEARNMLSGYVKGRTLLSGRTPTPSPDVDLPEAFGEQKPKKPKKKPKTQAPVEDTPTAVEVGQTVGTVWNWLFNS